MESTTCTVRIGEETKEYAAGTTYQEIAQEYQARYRHQIVLVFINQFHLQESKTFGTRNGLPGNCSFAAFQSGRTKAGSETDLV